MKRTLSTLLILALSVAFVPAAHAASGCTLATLSGNYSYYINGWYVSLVNTNGQISLTNSTIVNIMGVDVFDGAGNWSTNFTYCFNGSCGPGHNGGTYTVNSDCSGTVTLRNGAHFNSAIADGGKTVYLIGTDASANLSGVITKQ
jgi:hypothetical protein